MRCPTFFTLVYCNQLYKDCNRKCLVECVAYHYWCVLFGQFFSRLSTKSNKPKIQVCEDLFLEAGDVVEFSGCEGTGKSELMMAIAAECLISKHMSGSGHDTVYISTDYKFDITRFIMIVEHKLKEFIVAVNRTVLNSILDHFHLFYCSSLSECSMALMNVMNLLCPVDNVRAVIIDGINTYWGERKICMEKESSLLEIVDTLIKKYNVTVAVSHLLINEKCPFKSWFTKLVNYKYKLNICRKRDSLEAEVLIQQIYPDVDKTYNFNIIH